MNEIWTHITDPRFVAGIMVEKFEGRLNWRLEEPKFKPDLKIYVFVAALFAVGGAVLLGLRIGGVNGMIASGSISLGLIVSVALFYVKRKNDAIDHVLRNFDCRDINQLLWNYPDQLQIVIDHCDLEALRRIVNNLYVLPNFNYKLLEACFKSNNPRIPGNVYDGVTWVGSKAQEICKVAFDLEYETRPKNEEFFERFFALKHVNLSLTEETVRHFQKFPHDVQKFIDKMMWDRLATLASSFWSQNWSERAINDEERRIFKAIYYTNSPDIPGDSFSQIMATLSETIRTEGSLLLPLVSLICGYYWSDPDEIPATSKLASLRRRIESTCRVEVLQCFDQRLREAFGIV